MGNGRFGLVALFLLTALWPSIIPARFVGATARARRFGPLVLCCLVMAACAPTPVIEWQDLPKNILIASPARAFKIIGRGSVKEVPLPADRSLFGIAEADRLLLYRIEGDKLESTPFQLIDGRLVGNFRAGDTFLLHFPHGHTWTLSALLEQPVPW